MKLAFISLLLVTLNQNSICGEEKKKTTFVEKVWDVSMVMCSQRLLIGESLNGLPALISAIAC